MAESIVEKRSWTWCGGVRAVGGGDDGVIGGAPTIRASDHHTPPRKVYTAPAPAPR